MTALYLVVIVLLALALVYAGILLLRSRRRERRLLTRLRELRAERRTESSDAVAPTTWHRVVFDSVPVAVVVTDTRKSIIAINAQAQDVFGPPAQGEQAIMRVRHHALDGMLDTALAGNEREGQVTVDERIWYAYATPWREDRAVVGAILILDDTTERVQIARARRDLAANLGHELRTPLTSMRLMLETLQNGGMDEPELAERLVDRLAGETEAMIRLVEDLMTISLIEDGRIPLRLERQPVGDVIEEAVARVQPLIERKDLVIHTTIVSDLIVSLDHERFVQVLTNLLDNAIKFTPAGTVITIDAYRSEETVQIAIQDSGPGIPPSVLPRVFERFYKYNQVRTRGEKAGTGIGLAVVKHLVQAHGGHVWAESPPAEGARFVIELPAEESSRTTYKDREPADE